MEKATSSAHSLEEQRKIHFKTTAENILIIGISCLGGFLAGFAGTATSSSFVQKSFIEYFLSGSNATHVMDGVLGAFLAGNFIGGIMVAPVSRRFGRKIATATGAVLIIATGALQAGSVHYAMFITFRGICGIGAGMLFANCTVYMSEISPPHNRGLLAGTHGVAIILGCAAANAVGLGLYFVDKPYQWRLQYVFITGFACLLLVSLFFVPESPRWLVEKGRPEEAWIVLRRLHDNSDQEDLNTTSLARAEMVQIQAQMDAERKELQGRGYLHIFRTPRLRKRAICTIVVWLQASSSGSLVILLLSSVIFRSLGYGAVTQLSLSLAWIVVNLLGTILNILLMDRFGRVKLLVIGGYLCVACMAIEAALQRYYLPTAMSPDPNRPGLSACVAFFFIFIFCYATTIDCAAYVYTAEIWPTHIRSRGFTIGMTGFFGAAIAYNSPANLAFQEIG